ncbi:MAG TPA: hypothetical protein VK918_04615 [Pyrinomonadaceae bacterium]|nr:hypothetical protein [Pyrinomonadaceae bacterium]
MKKCRQTPPLLLFSFGTNVAIAIGERDSWGRSEPREEQMSKQVISVDGEDTVVREDTAKAFRGVHWALLSIGAFILIAAILFFSGVFKLAADSDPVPTPGTDRGVQSP